jgi:DNA-binding HxlR family transcriptional regulator
MGRSLLKPLNALAEWAVANVETIHGAQARFDSEADARAEAA